MTQRTIRLLDGNVIPNLALGVYEVSPRDCYRSCLYALKCGYRHIDSASWYYNEADVGKAVKDSGIPRHELFLTTKLIMEDHGYEKAVKAGELSSQKLGTYIDLYLIHAPASGRLEAWRGLETLKARGVVKSIGVSNYNIHHLQELLDVCQEKPVVNQIEIHPWRTQTKIVEFCHQQGIVIEAYSPLARGVKMQDPLLKKLAKAYSKTPAQILIKWSLQRGYIALPKSVTEKRIKENLEIDEWLLKQDDIERLAACDEDLVLDWDPTVWP